ncbi:MAG: outer rane biosis protein [Verrucomicrobiaceae bacterium]|nr:outer rane biosis protein [Verrucomicrobiaceae bacterium]
MIRSALLALLLPLALHAQPATTPLYWPDKNGPTMNGVVPEAEAARLPLEWDEASGKNITWKTDLPPGDEGHSTPIIGGDFLWFTSATADGTKQYINSFDRHTGKQLHHHLIFENPAPEPLGNPLNNYASPSPVIDAEGVYIHFGTYGTAKLNPLTAEVIWQRRDINVKHFRGPGSSPLLYGNLLILTFDGIDAQFTIALDKMTGKTVWKTPRSTDYHDLDKDGNPTRDGDMRKAYYTPSVFDLGGKKTLVSIGSRAAFGYDPQTGKELWTVTHGGFNAAPRALAMPGILILNTGSERSHMLGIRVDDKMTGDITASHTLWDHDKRNASESCPVLHNGKLYQVTRGGVLSCLDAKTGDQVWEDRLQGQHLPSAILASDRLYYSNDRGEVNVIRAGDKFELLATNKFNGGADDKITSSPAVADGAIFIRTKTHLFKLEKK